VTETLYDILGVDPQADAESIRAAYRRLALKYHPDLNPTVEDATRKMIKINLAYEILESPEKRSDYDESVFLDRRDGGRRNYSHGNYSQYGQESYIHRPSGTLRITRYPVVSSTMRSIGYDHKSKTLVVHFYHGGTYWYENVPNKIYQKLMSAPSIEKYFSLNIAYRYNYQRV
jgi:curved DNA-binding protein CbpA